MSENKIIQTIVIGQKLYREDSRRNAPVEIVEETVSKVGKKYFYLTGWEERYPISKENLKYEDKNYTQNNFQLYASKEEILDRREKNRLVNLLKKHFSWSTSGADNTLEQLRQVVEILNIQSNNSQP